MGEAVGCGSKNKREIELSDWQSKKGGDRLYSHYLLDLLLEKQLAVQKGKF